MGLFVRYSEQEPLVAVFRVWWYRDVAGDKNAPAAVLEGIAGRIRRDAAGKILFLLSIVQININPILSPYSLPPIVPPPLFPVGVRIRWTVEA